MARDVQADEGYAALPAFRGICVVADVRAEHRAGVVPRVFLLADFRALYVLYRLGRCGAVHAGDGDGTAEIRCACDDGDIVDALVHRAFAFDVDAGAEFLSERGK